MASVQTQPTEPTLATMAWRAVRRRCPACGERTVFRGWFAMEERCRSCDLELHREHGEVLSAVTLNLVVTLGTMLVVLLGFSILTWPDPPVALMAAITLAICVAFPVLLLPPSRVLWIALDLRLRGT